MELVKNMKQFGNFKSMRAWASLAFAASTGTFLLSYKDLKNHLSIRRIHAESPAKDWFNSILSSSKKDCAHILRDQQFTRSPNNEFSSPVAWFETNHYNANNPIEDRHCECSLPINEAYFFGIFDGHSGWYCSESLRLRLPLYISLAFLKDNELNEFQSNTLKSEDLVKYLGNLQDDCESFTFPLTFEDKQTRLKSGSFYFAKKVAEVSSMYGISDLLRYTFLSMDRDISREAIPDGQCNDPVWAGVSGAVAIGAYIKENDLFVANTGDCRAVLGVQSKNGSWYSIALSEDHTADNVAEVARIKAEHPGEEKSVILQKRLLGQLQPLRSFGDVAYKWTKELHREVLDLLYGRTVVPKSIYITPPYLTAQPDIQHKFLDKDDRFIILATDGLWDTVSNDEAVRIVGKYLDDLQNGMKHEENGATKLIRYALSQGSYERLNKMLELPAESKRHYHDDISVTVIYLDVNQARAKL